MIIDDVHRGITKRRKRKRIGRGSGSGHGKTSGRGHKGYGSRAGSSSRRGFEGGQTPIFMRVAKRGFNNRAFADVIAVINIRDLEQHFNDGDVVDIAALRQKGLVHGKFDGVKLLADGEISKKLTVQFNRYSASAEEKIINAGGKVETVVS